MSGFFAPIVIHATVLVLHLVVPAQLVPGYLRDASTGAPLRYRLNGLPVLALVLLAWWFAGARGLVPWDWLWVHRWAGLAGAVMLGLVFTAVIVLPAPRGDRSLLAELYLGRRDNPRMLDGRLDLKMWLYQTGATLLALNLCSFAAHHVAHHGASPTVLLHLALFGWFIVDYLFFERVHLYTYDLFAEKVGFKLGWGCLAFYPYFYAVGLWSTADRPGPGTPTVLLALYAAIFFVGWGLSRGANLQKFFFKLDPRARFLGIAPETIADDRHALLCSGFWGVARHVNYLGELLMALGLALSLGWPTALGPWLYPIYYLVLLLPRERDDHRRCAAKYGALWQRYCERVPWRIVPWIY